MLRSSRLIVPTNERERRQFLLIDCYGALGLRSSVFKKSLLGFWQGLLREILGIRNEACIQENT
jgi:hypothetical protein